jgi:prefoldin subunit 5
MNIKTDNSAVIATLNKRIDELEKERDSANLVIAKFAKYIIDYDDIDQYSHQAVHDWEELKWFADDISNQAKALKEQC